MKISILCSDKFHPIVDKINKFIIEKKGLYEIDLIHDKKDLTHGDFLFLISCGEIISEDQRNLYTNTFVLHASDLPMGKGWSPHIWEIIKGSKHITLTLFEAEANLDSGRIYKKIVIPVPRNALWDEINNLLFDAELDLINSVLMNYNKNLFINQDDIKATYYRKRTPEDSRIDPYKSIAEQFDLMRVCDPNRYPAFFDFHGCRYFLRLEKK